MNKNALITSFANLLNKTESGNIVLTQGLVVTSSAGKTFVDTLVFNNDEVFFHGYVNRQPLSEGLPIEELSEPNIRRLLEAAEATLDTQVAELATVAA